MTYVCRVVGHLALSRFRFLGLFLEIKSLSHRPEHTSIFNTCVYRISHFPGFVFTGPPSITIPPSNQISTEGKTVSFLCTSEADPRPDLVFLFNGTVLLPGPNIINTTTEIGQYGRRGNLTLTNISNEHSTGIYTCQAFNKYSPAANSSVNLTVYSEYTYSPIQPSISDAFYWDVLPMAVSTIRTFLREVPINGICCLWIFSPR